ncbi:MAG: LysR family transcriptional regulator [Myxococcota bacterium]
MDANQLLWVARLGRSGSVSAAARALGVAPSTLYRRLDRLESELGVLLFDRRQGVLEPTEAGRLVTRASDDVEARLSGLERELAALGSAVSGRVVVAVPEALALLVMDAVATVQKTHPDIAVEVRVSSEKAAMARGEADIALRVSADPGDTLVGRRVGIVGVAVYGTAPIAGPFDPGAHPWVCFDGSLAHTAQGRWERANVPEDRVRMRLASRTLFVEAVASGVGVGVLPCALADRRGGLVRLTEPLMDDSLTLWVLCHPAVRELPTVRTVMDALVALGQGFGTAISAS